MMLAPREGTRVALKNVAGAKEVSYAVDDLDERELSHSKDNSRAFEIPKVSETRKKVKERLPESFDELAIYLDRKFGRLAADVEQMTNELCEAEVYSERLRHRLLDGHSF